MQGDTLDVCYRDAHFVAVDKPAGLLVHRTPMDRGASRFALQLLRDQLGQRVYPVHRLDKPTSGVLLFARTPEAARRMGAIFTAQRVEKTYVAVVRGFVDEAGVIDYPLKVRRDTHAGGPGAAAQPAVTAYRRLAQIELPYAVGRYPTNRYSLLEVQPRTGRTHQIRRHLKHLFHPIIGDRKYGDDRHSRFFQSHFGCDRLLLAASALAFTHPFTDEPVLIAAPLGDAFRDVLAALSWEKALPAMPAR